MPILPKCCCCAKLETGGYIIGGIGILFGSLFIIGSIVIVNESNEVEDKGLITFSKFHKLIYFKFNKFFVFFFSFDFGWNNCYDISNFPPIRNIQSRISNKFIFVYLILKFILAKSKIRFSLVSL